MTKEQTESEIAKLVAQEKDLSAQMTKLKTAPDIQALVKKRRERVEAGAGRLELMELQAEIDEMCDASGLSAKRVAILDRVRSLRKSLVSADVKTVRPKDVVGKELDAKRGALRDHVTAARAELHVLKAEYDMAVAQEKLAQMPAAERELLIKAAGIPSSGAVGTPGK